MARIVTTSKGDAFYYSISENVGRNCPNVAEDVELVRYGFACIRNWAGPLPTPARPLLAAMSNWGGYGADLQAVIDAFQNDRNWSRTRDGHISKLPLTGATFYGATGHYMMADLNGFMCMEGWGQYYPRIDRSPMSGSVISAKVSSIFGYTK